jgi:uncharacterized surface protein with fasciclin (FAS1) repeats
MRRITLLAVAATLAVTVAAPVAARSSGPTIVEAAIAANQQSGEFDYLIEAVVTAGLAETLNGNRQFTVFAPTDQAFEDLFDALGVAGISEIDPATLRAVLLYHVAPGQRFSGSVLAASRIRTIGGGFITPSIQGGTAYVDDAAIVAADIDVANGVIHVIDSVLLP